MEREGKESAKLLINRSLALITYIESIFHHRRFVHALKQEEKDLKSLHCVNKS